MPLVSVIMNCYNSDTYLREAIESVYQQTFSDWEIIFFDNNSSDNSASIAQSYGERIKYIKNDVTVPLGEARNLAVAHANGQYISFLDCDDVWLPNRLEKMVNCLQAASQSPRPLALCYSDAIRISDTGEKMLPYSFNRKMYNGNVYQALIRDCFIDCSSTLMLKSVYEGVGGINTEYHQVEDWDLWFKIAKNYNVVYLPDILTQVRIHPGNQSRKLLAHLDEKIHLISHLAASDPSITNECSLTLKELKLQCLIVKCYEAFRFNKKNLVCNIMAMAWSMLKEPVISAKIALRYLNPRMLKLFISKYSNE